MKGIITSTLLALFHLTIAQTLEAIQINISVSEDLEIKKHLV
ncbi:hypothetical protein OAT71_00165 [Flavobacteriales bacterium]|jgi:hypothetical protein|nr:hypothetical protein [Flavobacteriales bacterium]